MTDKIREQMLEIYDALKYEPEAERMDAFLEALLEVYEAAIPFRYGFKKGCVLDKAIAKVEELEDGIF